MAKVLDVKFIGVELDQWMTDMTRNLYGEKAIKKKNNLINRGLKQAALSMLPDVTSSMLRYRNTGTSALHTELKRVRGGGWRIATPTRKKLGPTTNWDFARYKSGPSYGSAAYLGKKVSDRQGYYPASVEYGHTNKLLKRRIYAKQPMKRAFDSNEESSKKVAAAFYRSKLEAAMRKEQKKRIKDARAASRF